MYFDKCVFRSRKGCIALNKRYCEKEMKCAFFRSEEEHKERLKKYGDGHKYKKQRYNNEG